MEVIIKGKGQRVTLGTKDFKAAGGEGSTYIKGSTCYKVFHDVSRMIPIAKIHELAAITLPQIIKPIDVLLDTANYPAGYTMQALPDVTPLCTMFPRAFRERNNITPDTMLSLVRKLRECVEHVHSQDMLMVDINEMNFLVDHGFSMIYCIDVDSYKTPSFPSTALMPSVWDRIGSGGSSVNNEITGAHFNEGTDWFSFGIVSFQMFCGIHPFKGQHSTLKTIDQRMLHNVPAFDKSVSLPASVLPFENIPDVYRRWYKAVFKDGQRVAPPEEMWNLITVASANPQIDGRSGAYNFVLTDMQCYRSSITYVATMSDLTSVSFTKDGAAYINKYEVPLGVLKIPNGARAGFTKRFNHKVAAWVHGGIVKFLDLGDMKDMHSTIGAEQIMETDGRIYAKSGGNVVEVLFIEMPKTLVASKIVANVMEQSTRLFEGVAVQQMLGGYRFSIFPEIGKHYAMRIKELDKGFRIIDAKYSNRVLMVVTESNGKYDRYVIKFAHDFGDDKYTISGHFDIGTYAINFIVLDQGVGVCINENDEVEMFSNNWASSSVKTIKDPAVDSSCRLVKMGSNAAFTQGNRLVQFSVKQIP